MKKILIILVVILEIFLLSYSNEVVKEFTNTLNICLYSLMPTMFYSIFFSNLLIQNNFYKYIPNNILFFFERIFNISKEEVSILLLSLISGYPNNIKLLKNSKNEYLIYFTNFVNPIFFIGTVNNLYLKNIKVTILILISHYISTFILLFIFRNKSIYIFNNEENNNNISKSYYNSLKTTIDTLSIIFSNLLFISILVTLLKIILPFNKVINSFIIGILEFSKGIYELSYTNLNIYIKGLLILIIITFGSISIHFQSISINNKIKYIKYLIFRLLNVLVSIIIYLLMTYIIINV